MAVGKLEMNFSPFKVLKHVSEPFGGSYTLFQHKTNEHELFMLREEVCRSEDKFRSSLEFLSQRRRAASPCLLRIFKIDANPSKRQIYVMMEYGQLSLQQVRLRSFDSVMKCLLDVLKALAELEGLGLYHGAIEPAAILYFPRQKTFRLADRALPIAAPFTFYKHWTESRSELFLAPKLFNDVAGKSLKSLRPNFAKSDVFSVGLIALRLLYPYVVKVGKLYNEKTRLFDTVEFVQLLNRLLRTARSLRETDFLSLLKRRLVCFDEAQRAGPRAALQEFQGFLRQHYEDFENTFLPQNILIDTSPAELSGAGEAELPAPMVPVGSRLTFQRQTDDSTLTRQQIFEQRSDGALKPNLVEEPRPQKPELTPPAKFRGKDDELEEVSQRVNKPDTQDQTFQPTEEAGSDSLAAPPADPPLDQLYQVLVKIYVKKVKGKAPEELSGRLVDLDDFSKFTLNFQRELLRIKSKSVSHGIGRPLDKSEDFSYDSLHDSPLNLNFITRKRADKDSRQPSKETHRSSSLIRSEKASAQVSVPPPAPVSETSLRPESTLKPDSVNFYVPLLSQYPVARDKTATVSGNQVRHSGLSPRVIESAQSGSSRHFIKTLSSRPENSSFLAPTPGRGGELGRPSQWDRPLDTSRGYVRLGPGSFAYEGAHRGGVRYAAPPDPMHNLTIPSYHPQARIVRRISIERPALQKFTFLTHR